MNKRHRSWVQGPPMLRDAGDVEEPAKETEKEQLGR